VPGAAPATEFALSPVAPNPLRSHAALAYVVPAAARVRLSVVDVQGREVERLADGMRAPGRYTAVLDAGRLAPGLYFVRLQAAGAELSRRVVVIR